MRRRIEREGRGERARVKKRPGHRVPPFVVEKKVPIPEDATAFGRRKPRYDFDALVEAGDSFFVKPFEGTDASGTRQLLSGAASAYWRRRKLWAWRYKASIITENGVEGVRFWRLPDEMRTPLELGEY